MTLSSIELGPLAGLVTDRTRDICTDGTGRAWVDNGDGFVLSGLTLTPHDARFIGVGLVESGGGRVDDSRPIGDASLAGRVRVHVALPPVARDAPLISLRFPRPTRVRLDDFEFADDAARIACLTGSLLIAGVTGSGKTTLLSAILDSTTDADRVVVIEDVSEISTEHLNTAYLSTRVANPDGGGQIDLTQLVRESLRMRPDVLVIGEIRGAELRDYVLALTSGHRGIATVHAGSLADVGARLTALALVAGIPFDAVAGLVQSAISTVAVCERVGSGVTVTVGKLVIDNGTLLATAE